MWAKLQAETRFISDCVWFAMLLRMSHVLVRYVYVVSGYLLKKMLAKCKFNPKWLTKEEYN